MWSLTDGVGFAGDLVALLLVMSLDDAAAAAKPQSLSTRCLRAIGVGGGGGGSGNDKMDAVSLTARTRTGVTVGDLIATDGDAATRVVVTTPTQLRGPDTPFRIGH
jgi:hypothetical protein